MRRDTSQQQAAQPSAFPSPDRQGSEPEPDWAGLNLIGRSRAFRAALASMLEWSRVDATVLITGETGTGKELGARAIHYLGCRREGPFIPVNCGAISESLLETELFGHVRGAFTDAKRDGRGMIALAQGGTLFLDEVDSLSPRGQAAILRFVQDHCYRPIGGPRFEYGDVRVIAASNADLAALSRTGHFREDLLYRLNLLTVDLPPLREREGDALLLARAFVQRLCVQYGVQREFDAESIQALQRPQPWPGNVRELEHLVHRSFLRARGALVHLTLMGAEPAAPVPTPCTSACFAGTGFAEAKAEVIADFERRYVGDLLQQAKGNLSLAARLAGKERSRFGRLVKKYGLQRAAASEPAPPRR